MHFLKDIEHPRSAEIEFYEERGGYSSLRKAFTLPPLEIVEEVKTARLRGRGGSGFEAGLKWEIVANSQDPRRVLVCNADEGEPGTFKDRRLLEERPHLVLEGMIIASRALGAELGFIYLRYEYPKAYNNLMKAIKEAEARGYLGKNILGSGMNFQIRVHQGAGAYICGEETALLESLEGRRGHPRLKPPYPAYKGFMGLPTIVNNVETLCNIPLIVDKGGSEYASIGTPGSPGPKLFSVSGHVNKPGIYEFPMGTTIRELIYEHAGGIKDGRALKAIIPGGISTPILTASQVDCKLDFISLREHGSSLGSGAVMVFDETTSIAMLALRTASFFEHESCSKCTPCREGTGWLKAIFKRLDEGQGRSDDLELIEDVSDNLISASFCPLGVSAATVARGFIRSFREELSALIKGTASSSPDPRKPLVEVI